eukprot:1167104-Lingulodinium_polyedra.AAC.1
MPFGGAPSASRCAVRNIWASMATPPVDGSGPALLGGASFASGCAARNDWAFGATPPAICPAPS